MDSLYDPAMGYDACHLCAVQGVRKLREGRCKSPKARVGRRRFLLAVPAAGLFSVPTGQGGRGGPHEQQLLPKPHVAPYTEAIEFASKASAGEISGNLIVDFTNGITLYELGADIRGNVFSNTQGSRASDKVLRLPPDPSRPARMAW
jgi:hypothetical protein